MFSRELHMRFIAVAGLALAAMLGLATAEPAVAWEDGRSYQGTGIYVHHHMYAPRLISTTGAALASRAMRGSTRRSRTSRKRIATMPSARKVPVASKARRPLVFNSRTPRPGVL